MTIREATRGMEKEQTASPAPKSPLIMEVCRMLKPWRQDLSKVEGSLGVHPEPLVHL